MQKIESLSLDTASFARKIFGNGFVPIHRPIFAGNEREYLVDCIDSNFVSSVGARVTELEQVVADYTGSKYGIATVNGTSALHIATLLAGVRPHEEVITQALTFVATCNAISYSGAMPIFIDVDLDTMGLSPLALERFLELSAEKTRHGTFNKNTGRRISACIPMHTFGFPCRIAEISEICSRWNIPLIEDAAESLGSFVGDRHTGTFGAMGIISFNGNKVITTGGGGMIITDDSELARRAKHITTTAKLNHSYEFIHDEVGYNYRMPNLNAALGCAQMEKLKQILQTKKELASRWRAFFCERDIAFVEAIDGSRANHWLNTIILDSRDDRDKFLSMTNDNDTMTRPIWRLNSKLEMYKDCYTDGLENSKWLEDRAVNIPSSVPNYPEKSIL